MRPHGYTDYDQLTIARERAASIERDWRSANGPRRSTAPKANRLNPFGAARLAAARVLIELGRRLMPVKTEPCA